MFRIERFEPAIRSRTWFLEAKVDPEILHGIFLKSGSALVERDDGDTWLEAASLFLSPSLSELRLKLEAGSEAVRFMASASLVATVVGHGADAAGARILIENPISCDLNGTVSALAIVEQAFSLFLEEADSRKSGSEMLIEAGLKTVLAIALRSLSVQGTRPGHQSRSTQLLQQFRQLLETHFRMRWSVQKYAKAIGIGADRLHDVCTAELGRAPSVLIQERVTYEARLLLSNSSLTVNQISLRLGYRDPSHFSKSFRRVVGKPPRAYREELMSQTLVHDQSIRDFSDWP